MFEAEKEKNQNRNGSVWSFRSLGHLKWRRISDFDPSASLRKWLGIWGKFASAAAGILGLIGSMTLLSACMSETLERQAEQISQQNEEIARQRKELEALAAGKQIQDQQQQDCNRAFHDYFDKAQLSANREQAISLYTQGLAICPNDDVARYELGRALADTGRRAEAEKEFEAALKINPEFAEARRQLDALRQSR